MAKPKTKGVLSQAADRLIAPDGDRALCGVKVWTQEPCQRPAGQHTPHPGTGRCVEHERLVRYQEIKAQVQADVAKARSITLPEVALVHALLAIEGRLALLEGSLDDIAGEIAAAN